MALSRPSRRCVRESCTIVGVRGMFAARQRCCFTRTELVDATYQASARKLLCLLIPFRIVACVRSLRAPAIVHCMCSWCADQRRRASLNVVVLGRAVKVGVAGNARACSSRVHFSNNICTKHGASRLLLLWPSSLTTGTYLVCCGPGHQWVRPSQHCDIRGYR